VDGAGIKSGVFFQVSPKAAQIAEAPAVLPKEALEKLEEALKA
jgi:hypothetical protein